MMLTVLNNIAKRYQNKRQITGKKRSNSEPNIEYVRPTKMFHQVAMPSVVEEEKDDGNALNSVNENNTNIANQMGVGSNAQSLAEYEKQGAKLIQPAEVINNDFDVDGVQPQASAFAQIGLNNNLLLQKINNLKKRKK